MGPESIPFVFELGDTFAKAAVLNDGCQCGGWIDEALRTLAESGTVCAHAFRVRGPLPRSTGPGALVGHSLQREVTTSRITTRTLAAGRPLLPGSLPGQGPTPEAMRWTPHLTGSSIAAGFSASIRAGRAVDTGLRPAGRSPLNAVLAGHRSWRIAPRSPQRRTRPQTTVRAVDFSWDEWDVFDSVDRAVALRQVPGGGATRRLGFEKS